eukprot:8805601-Pyramimonas_sp.AAC.1
MVLALVQRTCVLQACGSFTDGGRVVFNIWSSLSRGAHVFHKFAAASSMEGSSFSSCGSRLSAAPILCKSLLQDWHSGTTYECHDITVTLTRGADVPGIALWQDWGFAD